MQEEFKYFVSYVSNGIVDRPDGEYNVEIKSTYIESIEDIRRIEDSLKICETDKITIINYRMF